MTVIHHWMDHRQLIALAPAGMIDSRVSADNRVDSSWPSQRSQRAIKPYIGSESQFLSTHVHPTPPLGGGFRQNIAVMFGTEKLEWCGYRKVKKLKICLFILTECMYECDRYTGRQTDGHRMTANTALA